MANRLNGGSRQQFSIFVEGSQWSKANLRDPSEYILNLIASIGISGMYLVDFTKNGLEFSFSNAYAAVLFQTLVPGSVLIDG